MIITFFEKKIGQTIANTEICCTFASQLRNTTVQKPRIIGALVQLVRIHACHAWGHGFESRTYRQQKNKQLEITGALVQLVRIHACHAWGHGFESRTHRKALIHNRIRAFFVSGRKQNIAFLRSLSGANSGSFFRDNKKAPEMYNTSLIIMFLRRVFLFLIF